MTLKNPIFSVNRLNKCLVKQFPLKQHQIHFSIAVIKVVFLVYCFLVITDIFYIQRIFVFLDDRFGLFDYSLQLPKDGHMSRLYLSWFFTYSFRR